VYVRSRVHNTDKSCDHVVCLFDCLYLTVSFVLYKRHDNKLNYVTKEEKMTGRRNGRNKLNIDSMRYLWVIE
jgi:hypothetical protein